MDHVPNYVTYRYGEWQPMLREMKGVEFVKGFPDMEMWTDDRRRLVITDYLMN